ncbi:MAG: hypothetical protein F6J93_15935 [Oscillatoria sp. SIO1A7]|nr:hypothetical protein [Oscillatoria sp. SIO1A7]
MSNNFTHQQQKAIDALDSALKALKSSGAANEFEQALGVLKSLGGALGPVFSAIGFIEKLTGNDPLSQINRKLTQIENEINEGFEDLKHLIHAEFAISQIIGPLTTIHTAYKMVETSIENPHITDAKKALKDIDYVGVLKAATTLQELVDGSLPGDKFFPAFAQEYGNSQDKLINVGMKIFTAITRSRIAYVAQRTTQYKTLNNSIQQQIQTEVDSDFSTKNKVPYEISVISQLSEKLKTFDPNGDVEKYLRSVWNDIKFKNGGSYSGDNANETGNYNCLAIAKKLHENYPSRFFHVFLTYYGANNDPEDLNIPGYICYDENVGILHMQDTKKLMGSDWDSGFYITVFNGPNKTDEKCVDGEADWNTIQKCFTAYTTARGKIAGATIISEPKDIHPKGLPLEPDDETSQSQLDKDVRFSNNKQISCLLQKLIDCKTIINGGFLFCCGTRSENTFPGHGHMPSMKQKCTGKEDSAPYCAWNYSNNFNYVESYYQKTVAAFWTQKTKA